jgi:hypothetical protein
MMASPLPASRATRTLLVLTGDVLFVNYVETMVVPSLSSSVPDESK